MLDESLPTFFYKSDSVIYLSQNGSEPTAKYTLRRPDPKAPSARNIYSLAIFDSFSPEILYAEVLLAPEWTHATLSAEQIRQNGGVAPPPQPIIPNEFIIQLYNPDQQIAVKQIQGSWGASAHWEFELPQQTFRRPSGSALDRSQSDPSAVLTTPKIQFKWKRDSKLGKDLVCSVSGKTNSVEVTSKKQRGGGKEPDITVALFRNLRELSIYEPNLHRVDVEDAKGLEVVLLLGAAAIRDVFFGQPREVFNLDPTFDVNIKKPLPPKHRSSSGSSPTSSLPMAGAPPPFPAAAGHYQANAQHAGQYHSNPTMTPHPHLPPRPHTTQPYHTFPPNQQVNASQAGQRPPSPPLSPRARLQREKQAAADAKAARKLSEAEARAARRRQADVDKETEKLRKKYAKSAGGASDVKKKPTGVIGGSSHQQQHQQPYFNPHSTAPQGSGPFGYANVGPAAYNPFGYSSGYSEGPNYAGNSYLATPQQQYQRPLSGSGVFGGSPSYGQLQHPSQQQQSTNRKEASRRRSIFGLRSVSNGDDGSERLKSKKSSVF